MNKRKFNRQYIYIISNPAFVGWLKIGKTSCPEQRISHYNTSDPLRRYKIDYITPVKYPELFEGMFKQHCIHNGEWTQLCLSDCIKLIVSMKEYEKSIKLKQKN